RGNAERRPDTLQTLGPAGKQVGIVESSHLVYGQWAFVQAGGDQEDLIIRELVENLQRFTQLDVPYASTGHALLREQRDEVVRLANRLSNGRAPAHPGQDFLAVEPDPESTVRAEVAHEAAGFLAVQARVAQKDLLHADLDLGSQPHLACGSRINSRFMLPR